MGRDPKTPLAEKIRSVECQPILWKKHEVWSAVHDRISRTKRRSRIYHYAAAVIAFMFLQVYTLRESPPISMPAPSLNQAVATTIDKSTEKRLAGKPAEKIKKERKMQHETLSPKIHGIDADKPVTSMTVKQTTEPDVLSTAAPEAVTIEFEPDIEDLWAVAEEPFQEPRIKAIVGVVSWTDAVNAEARRQKRKLLHKLDPPETEYDETTRPSMVIARLK